MKRYMVFHTFYLLFLGCDFILVTSDMSFFGQKSVFATFSFLYSEHTSIFSIFCLGIAVLLTLVSLF